METHKIPAAGTAVLTVTQVQPPELDAEHTSGVDIYLILIVMLTVYLLKHLMLIEDICFQAAYAKLQ